MVWRTTPLRGFLLSVVGLKVFYNLQETSSSCLTSPFPVSTLPLDLILRLVGELEVLVTLVMLSGTLLVLFTTETLPVSLRHRS